MMHSIVYSNGADELPTPGGIMLLRSMINAEQSEGGNTIIAGASICIGMIILF